MTAPWLDDGDIALYHGDALDVLRSLPAGIEQTCVTSPPYWGLRSYLPDGHDDKATELGLEATPDAYVERLVLVMREVWRVLRADGTLWLNLGDSYASSGTSGQQAPTSRLGVSTDGSVRRAGGVAGPNPKMVGQEFGRAPTPPGLKAKDLVGIPWKVAFALQADGWYLRSDIIWAKPNPMPESVTDRPTKAHEYVFLLAKQPRYYYDADAIREAQTEATLARYEYGFNKVGKGIQANGASHTKGQGADGGMIDTNPAGRNARSVWEIATQPTPEAHFATYPEALVRRCILAGSRAGDTVLDPFVGSGTTCLVARKHGRRCIGIDLSEEYLAIAARRTAQLSLLGDGSLVRGGGAA